MASNREKKELMFVRLEPGQAMEVKAIAARNQITAPEVVRRFISVCLDHIMEHGKALEGTLPPE